MFGRQAHRDGRTHAIRSGAGNSLGRLSDGDARFTIVQTPLAATAATRRPTRNCRGCNSRHCFITCTSPIQRMAWCATRRNSNAPVSIAAVGMALASIPVVVERKVLIRSFAAKISRTRLQFLHDLPQGPEANCSGYKGFFYHFLDIESGRRVWQCELSTIDSAFLFAGALTAATYFDNDNEDEVAIRRLANAFYCRRRLELGPQWRGDTDARLAAGDWIHSSSLAGLRRGTAALHPWTGFADARASAARATPRTAQLINGRRSTAANCSTVDRYSRISFRTCGSTSATCAMRSCGSTAATTSKTAGKRRSCSRSMPFATHLNSRAMANTAGVLPPATGRAT